VQLDVNPINIDSRREHIISQDELSLSTRGDRFRVDVLIELSLLLQYDISNLWSTNLETGIKR